MSAASEVSRRKPERAANGPGGETAASPPHFAPALVTPEATPAFCDCCNWRLKRLAGEFVRNATAVGHIALWELQSLFRRPSTYVLILAAVLTAGWGFSWLVTLLARGGGLALRQADDPIVQFVGPNLFLVGFCTLSVPLVTMGLVADERRRGSWELLLTSPVSIGQVLVAKFLAGWCLFVLSLTPWYYCLAVLRFWNGRTQWLWGGIPWFEGTGVPFDPAPVVCGLTGAAVIGGTFIAIGVACSSLCRRPVSASLLTFMAMTAILAVGFAPRAFEAWGVARDRLEWIEAASWWRHLEGFSRGAILPRVLVGHVSLWCVLLWCSSTLSRRLDDA